MNALQERASWYTNQKPKPLPLDGVEILRPPLMERTQAGITVELHYFGGETILSVTDEDGPHCALVPKFRALDAFWHPYIYLGA